MSDTNKRRSIQVLNEYVAVLVHDGHGADLIINPESTSSYKNEGIIVGLPKVDVGVKYGDKVVFRNVRHANLVPSSGPWAKSHILIMHKSDLLVVLSNDPAFSYLGETDAK